MFTTMQTHENIVPLLIFTTPSIVSMYIMLDRIEGLNFQVNFD